MKKKQHILLIFGNKTKQVLCDLFIERFEEKDALLAYMWMTDLMSSIDCYDLLNKKEGDVLSGQQ